MFILVWRYMSSLSMWAYPSPRRWKIHENELSSLSDFYSTFRPAISKWSIRQRTNITAYQLNFWVPSIGSQISIFIHSHVENGLTNTSLQFFEVNVPTERKNPPQIWYQLFSPSLYQLVALKTVFFRPQRHPFKLLSGQGQEKIFLA